MVLLKLLLGLDIRFSMWMTKDINHLFHTNKTSRLTNRLKNVIKNMKQLWKR